MDGETCRSVTACFSTMSRMYPSQGQARLLLSGAGCMSQVSHLAKKATAFASGGSLDLTRNQQHRDTMPKIRLTPHQADAIKQIALQISQEKVVKIKPATTKGSTQ
jgi:hypothetical protein